MNYYLNKPILVWRYRLNMILFLVVTAAHRHDMGTCLLLSSTSLKISTRQNLARVTADEQNGPGLQESPDKALRFRLDENC